MKKTIVFSILIFSILISNAQDAYIYNSNQSLVYLNPSFAGSNGGFRNQFSYRDLWSKLTNGYNTYINTFDVYLKPLRGGIAISWMQNNLFNYAFQSNILSISYAQYFSFKNGDLKIVPSLQIAYAKRTADYSSFNFVDGFVPQWGDTLGPYYEKQYADFSSGLLVNYKNKLYVGTSFFHMNQPDIGFWGTRKLPIGFNFHASYNFKLSEKSCLQALYRTNSQSMFWTNRLGLNLVSFNHLITGIGLVNWEEPVLSAGYRNNYFNLLIGHDFTLSKLAGNTGGSWELHASFNLRNKEQRKTLTSFESW